MIRLTLITLLSIYLVLVVVGRDDGVAAQQAPITAEAVPEAPKISAPVAAQPTAAGIITPARLERMPGPALHPSPEYRVKAEPVAATGGALWVVNANSLNVRSGPATSNGVVDRIGRDEEVLVVADPGNGWVNIRIEGDGVSGWVSKKLLRPAH